MSSSLKDNTEKTNYIDCPDAALLSSGVPSSVGSSSSPSALNPNFEQETRVPQSRVTSNQYIEEYKKYEDNDTVSSHLNITPDAGLRILTRPKVFGKLAASGCLFEDDEIYTALSAKERRFVDEFAVDYKHKEAALRAGYSKNYPSINLLRNPCIKFCILSRQQEAKDLAGINAGEVLMELHKLAFSDIGDFVEFDSDGIRIKSSEDVDTTAISEIHQTQHGVKIKLHNKTMALEALGKNLGLFTQKIEITGKDGDPIEHNIKVTALRSKIDSFVNRMDPSPVANALEAGISKALTADKEELAATEDKGTVDAEIVHENE